MTASAGYLETPDSPFLASAMFGVSAPDPLVMSTGPDNFPMGAGLGTRGPAPFTSGVQTVDSGNANPDLHVPSAASLLKPMHSEAFWVLLLALLALGIFSGSGAVRVGRLKASVGS